jgi:hypothetical protein
MQDFQELADEAFRDLLQKHGRPTDLKTALRQGAGVDPVAEKPSKKGRDVPSGNKRLPRRLSGIDTIKSGYPLTSEPPCRTKRASARRTRSRAAPSRAGASD